jgi:hypothetical protein
MKVQFNDKTSIDNRPDLSDAEKITGPNINEIKNVVNTNAEEFEAIKETVENNNTDITTLKNDNNKNKTDIKNLQADNTTNKKSIEELKQKNAEQDESIKTNASEIENLKQENIEIKAENERLRDDIKSIALVGEESGESIDLEDSSEARFNKFEIGGNHKQETREGYNLLDMSKAKGGTSNGITCSVNSNGSYSYVGTATNNAINVFMLGYYGENVPTLFKLAPGTYYIKDVLLFNNTQSINSKKDQFFWTINEETNITGVRAVQAEIGKTYNEIKYPIVALSNKEVKWEPYGAMPSLEFPSEIKTVKDNINEVICNKNLLNQYKIVPYYIDSENKVQSWEGEVESLYIQIKSNTAYTVSKKISARFTIATSTEVPRVGLTVNAVSNRQANKLTITSKNEDKYLMIFYYKKTDDTLSSQEIISSIQVEEGTVATAYVKHQSQSIAMPVQQEMLKDDYFDFENEKQTNLFEKIIVDGDKIRANSIRDTSDGNFQWSFSIATKVDKLRKIYSNVAMQATNFAKLNGVVLSKNSNNVYIKSNKDIFGDKEFSISNLNEILKKMYDTGNQVVFYIEKASDTELNFTDEQKVVAKKIKETLHTYKNITHIYSEDEVSPILNIEYAKDLNTVINNIQAQIINNASEEVSG